jgi:hypothetical protein
MPWFIRQEDEKYCVVKGTQENPLEVEACHETEAEAMAQMRALYASEAEKSLGDSLISFGSAAKVLDENGTVGGYLVQFTNEQMPDLEDDYFDASTEYGPFDKSIVFYQHGMDVDLGRKPLKNLASLKLTDTGVWFEHQLEIRDAYEGMIYQLAQQGKLGLSSGTAAHLVEREQKGDVYHIKKWFLGIDASYTPNPANPYSSVMPLKSYFSDEANEQPEAEAQPEAVEAVGVDGRDVARIKAKIIDTILMED